MTIHDICTLLHKFKIIKLKSKIKSNVSFSLLLNVTARSCNGALGFVTWKDVIILPGGGGGVMKSTRYRVGPRHRFINKFD